jgi:hypothetical protein
MPLDGGEILGLIVANAGGLAMAVQEFIVAEQAAVSVKDKVAASQKLQLVVAGIVDAVKAEVED